tara:strand:- start:611 stop:823 length:213 start_codon:yes stop_codon:yes gene_type:complete
MHESDSLVVSLTAATLLMKNLREEGFSFQKIADILYQKGVETKVGGKWIKQSVRSVINRKGVFRTLKRLK